MTIVSLTAEQVRAAVSMSEAIDAVRAAFVGLGAGEFEHPQRVVLGSGRFLVMSAHHRPTSSAMVKTLSLNFDRRPAITGTVVWSETATLGCLVADAASVTALRTGAIVGVATALLARPDARRMTLIGAGAQAADQFRAVRAVRPIDTLTVVDLQPERAERLLAVLEPELEGIRADVSSDANAAVSRADIVSCATTSRLPLFDAGALQPDVHVNAIGSFRPDMQELPEDLLANSTIVVDEHEAVAEEAGEIINAVRSGAITLSDIADLSTALSNTAPRARWTVFKTVGVAVEDWAIARLLSLRYAPALGD